MIKCFRCYSLLSPGKECLVCSSQRSEFGFICFKQREIAVPVGGEDPRYLDNKGSNMLVQIQKLKDLAAANQLSMAWICGQGFYVYDGKQKMIANTSAGSTPVPLTAEQCWDLPFLLDETVAKVETVIATRELKAQS